MRYANSKYKFSLYRPKTSTLKTQGFGSFLPLTKAPVAAIVLPQSLFKGTNLIEAGVYIGASTSLAVVPKWDVPVAGSTEVSAGTTAINGVSFAIFTSTGNAAGNVYEEKVYRTLSHNFCLEVVELLHYGDLANYSPGSVVQFDKVKLQGYLEAMVDTLTLTP